MLIHMSNLNWELAVDLEGGRIEKLIHKHNLILGSFKRIDEKKGSSHLCIPNFAGEGETEFGLPFHGPARNESWFIRDEKKGLLTILCKIPPTDSYHAELYIEQKIELISESFKHTITVEHTEGEPVPVNVGVHNYWSTPTGWKGLKINGVDVTEKVIKNGWISVRKHNRITLPGSISYNLNLRGFNHMVLWSAHKNTMHDTHYVCIEPVRIYGSSYKNEKKLILSPHKQFICSQEIVPTTS